MMSHEEWCEARRIIRPLRALAERIEKPTDEMIEAIKSAFNEGDEVSPAGMFNAAIAAAGEGL